MSYYRLLKMRKDPFSSSPDPFFLYSSRECYDYLSKLEIAIRLRRGLNVLAGDIGTGKTTIGRSLLKLFNNESEHFLTYLILNPSFESGMEFLSFLLRTFSIPLQKESPDAYKNAIQNFLFEKGVEDNKLIVLIIDEAQKLTPSALEILRELLNFETNDYKLLQVILLGQLDLLETIRQQTNLMDRVNACFILHPLNRTETKAMINHRLAVAGLEESPYFFTRGAINAIYKAARGYPRKIVFLCHHALIAMLIKKKNRVDRAIILNVIRMRSDLEKNPRRFLARKARWQVATALLVSCLAIILIYFMFSLPELLFSPFSKMQEEDSKLSAATLQQRISASIYTPPDISKEEKASENIVLVVKKGETLSSLAHRIYGRADLEVLKLIKNYNPEIKDINNLRAGQTIRFPYMTTEPVLEKTFR